MARRGLGPCRGRSLPSTGLILRNIGPDYNSSVVLGLGIRGNIVRSNTFINSKYTVSRTSTSVVLSLIVNEGGRGTLRLTSLFLGVVGDNMASSRLHRLRRTNTLRSISRVPTHIGYTILN